MVETALSFSLLTGTSTKEVLRVSRKVPPGGYAFTVAMICILWNEIENEEVDEEEEK